MRWPLLFVVACTGSRPHVQPPVPDAAADASTIDSSADWFARTASGVVLGTSTIAWSELEASCGLEVGPGCHGPGPMVTIADAQGQVSTLVAGLFGASAIAGDESGWFYNDRSAGAVMRVRAGGAPVKFSAGNTWPVGPVVDATYVYWFEPGANGAGSSIMRASRTGDGSDAMIVAQPTAFQSSLYAFAGDLWWWTCSVSCEIYRATSQAPVRTGAMIIVGADASALYLLDFGAGWSLEAMASDGTTTTLLVSQSQQMAPDHLIADGGELFWSSAGSLYRAMPNASPTRIVDGLDVTAPFAVTPTQILYDFTPRGYSTIAR